MTFSKDIFSEEELKEYSALARKHYTEKGIKVFAYKNRYYRIVTDPHNIMAWKTNIISAEEYEKAKALFEQFPS